MSSSIKILFKKNKNVLKKPAGPILAIDETTFSQFATKTDFYNFVNTLPNVTTNNLDKVTVYQNTSSGIRVNYGNSTAAAFAPLIVWTFSTPPKQLNLIVSGTFSYSSMMTYFRFDLINKTTNQIYYWIYGIQDSHYDRYYAYEYKFNASTGTYKSFSNRVVNVNIEEKYPNLINEGNEFELRWYQAYTHNGYNTNSGSVYVKKLEIVV